MDGSLGLIYEIFNLWDLWDFHNSQLSSSPLLPWSVAHYCPLTWSICTSVLVLDLQQQRIMITKKENRRDRTNTKLENIYKWHSAPDPLQKLKPTTENFIVKIVIVIWAAFPPTWSLLKHQIHNINTPVVTIIRTQFLYWFITHFINTPSCNKSII